VKSRESRQRSMLIRIRLEQLVLSRLWVSGRRPDPMNPLDERIDPKYRCEWEEYRLRFDRGVTRSEVHR
jgi:hypothetical protein